MSVVVLAVMVNIFVGFTVHAFFGTYESVAWDNALIEYSFYPDSLVVTALSLGWRLKFPVRLIGKGLTRNDIAKSIHRSPKTVDNHRASIMTKLDIHDRVELARYAIAEGLAEI